MTEIRRTYRFYVKPTERLTDESFSALLTQNSISPAETEVASIQVLGSTVYGVYQVPYAFITLLKHSVHRDLVHVYVQEGRGAIRPFALYTERKRAKPVRDVAQRLKPK